MAVSRLLWPLLTGLCLLMVTTAVAVEAAAGIPTLAGAPLTSVVGLAGKRTELPCDMTPQPGDSVLIVLWYRDGSETPVFSYDLRNRVESRRRWSNGTVFSDRADFVPQSRPATLTLQPSVRQDSALYRCRVDYQFSRTRYALVNLTVIVPPKNMEIISAGGEVTDTVIGALLEGQTLRLSCIVRGAYPRPRVLWRSGKSVLSTKTRAHGDDVIIDYVIESLSRADLHRKLTCSATNTNLTAPTTRTVMIDMNFRPLHVLVLGDQKSFSSGRRYQLVCQCAGSRPPAAVTWYIGGVRVPSDPSTMTSHRGNVTMSTLSFTPRPEDDRRSLLCRCQNPKMETSALEYSSTLTVHYIPQVSITLSRLLDPEKINEGGDVVFECHVRANPAIYRREWRHNGRALEHSQTEGVIISNYSLALQSVERSDSGVYMCVGFNSEGEGESNSIFLDVKYAPVCRPGLQRIYGVAKRQRADILCAVEANPAQVRFSWQFNNTSEMRPLPDSAVNSTSSRSLLRYRPSSELDYGTIVCRASNAVGGMASPCLFHVLAAGPPEPPFNCSVHNSSSRGLLVACLPGFDGGLAQNFLLSVFADGGNRLVYSQTAAAPRWWVDGLPAGRRYRIQAVSLNARGRSSAVVFDGSTRPAPPTHRQTAQDFTLAEMQPEPRPPSPLLAALVGALGSLALLALASVVACLACRRRHQQPPPAKPPPEERGPEDGEDRGTEDGEGRGTEDGEDRGPDVVPYVGKESSYEVYQIAGGTSDVTVDGGGACNALRNGKIPLRNEGIPLRTLNHIVPPSYQGGSAHSMTSPPGGMTSGRRPPAVYATVDRRRGQGAVSQLRSSDTATPLLAASEL